ncbi:Hypothetical protein DEACI_0913 [Acididesulfobacillus acetoxydans]|uniref:Uncharacterized protein n=1 Tax=Acididesulfobacillus acetoxydans TaxID=1561005 RepID=A0A8S0WWG2_9FIRM|nr:Hypothetical protein DEACI_0913 [Acididesulfobacillus acetoxydans]CEJ09639.1 Hypothetical protein DEACI_4124 [Acididesulfobacillus acetoxydans]
MSCCQVRCHATYNACSRACQEVGGFGGHPQPASFSRISRLILAANSGMAALSS